MPGTSLSPQAKVATLTLPTKDTRVAASVWPTAYGTILFLAEINLPATTSQEIIGKLTDKLESTWHSDKFYNLNSEQALEVIIAELNPILNERARLMGNPLAPRYQFIIALYQGGELSLSSIGRLNTLLVSNEHVTNILGMAPSKIRGNAKPTFDFITTGQLKAGEALLLSSSCLLDYFSTDKIRSLFNNNAPGAALRNIEQYVASLPTHSPIGLLALKLTAANQIAGTEPSLTKLIQTKDQTRNLLKPSMWNFVKDRISHVNLSKPSKIISSNQALEVDESKPIKAEPEPIQIVKKEKISWRRKISSSLTRASNVSQKTVNNLTWLSSRESIKIKITEQLEHYILTWRTYTAFKKVVAVIGLVALLVFSGSIVRLGRNSLAEQDHYNYTKLLSKITQEQSNVEAALIYRDSKKAQTALEEVNRLILSLPHNTKSQQDQYDALLKNLAWLENRVAHKTDITTLTTWVTLPDQSNWFSINQLNSNFLIFNKLGQIVYINKEGKITQTTDIKPTINSPEKTIALDKYILITDPNNNQYWFEPNSKTSAPISNKIKMNDAAFYDGRIYYISDDASIWRTTKTGNDLARPTRWLKVGEQLPNNSQALAIDGYVYVAGNNLFKYSRGQKQEFSTDQVEPSLTSASKLITQSDVDYIYLIDKAEKRLVIYDKKGHLMAQLSFSSLNVNDMTVDAANKTLYILSDSTVSKLNLNEYVN